MKTVLKLFVVVSLSVASITQIKAQGKITGTISDEKNQAIPFSTVALLAARDSSLVQGKITDEAGLYEMSSIADGNYLVRVSFVGYPTTYSSPFTISPEAKLISLGTIALKETAQTLKEVTVVAQKPLIERLPDRLVMNLENSILTKGATANEILKVAPLVSSGVDGGLTLRGKSNVMILIDGKTIPGATLGSILQNMPADEVEKIEIITNPSAKYDASASGGVINIITKKGLQLGMNGAYRLYASQGMYSKVYTGVNLNYRTQKLNVFGDVSYSAGRNYRHQVYNRNFPTVRSNIENNTDTYTDSYTPSAKVGLDYSINANHSFGATIDAYISTSNDDMQTQSAFGNHSTSPDSSLTSTNDGRSEYRLYNFNVNYKGKLSQKGNEISLMATHSIYNQNTEQVLNYQTFANSGEPLGGKQTLRTDFPSDVAITIAQTDYTHPLTKNTKAEIGFKYTGIDISNQLIQERSVTNRSVSNSGYDEQVAAGYINLNTTIKKFGVQAGVRGENTNTNVANTLKRKFFNFFPSVSIYRSLSDKASLSLSYSRKIDRPMYENLLPIRVYSDPYIIREGNPSLKPQYSDVLEASTTINSITLLGGYTRTKDAMVELPIQDEATHVTTNFTKNFSQVNAYYLSVVLPYNVTPWWQTNNTITGMYNNLSSLISSDLTFKTDITSVMINSTNVFTFKNGWRGQLMGYYNSKSQYGIIRFEPRYSISMGIGKDILNKRGYFKVEVDDIFWSERYNGDSTIGALYQSFKNYGDSRRVRLSFSYKFGKQTVKPKQYKSLGNESENGRLKL